MSKIIDFDVEARRKLKDGINSLAQAVVITLGPKGRTVIFEKMNGEPQVCNDGVTVAKQIELDDPVEDWGQRCCDKLQLALENAASVAMMMLTTECVIAKKREKEKDLAPAMPRM